jgi:hypothetical protein
MSLERLQQDLVQRVRVGDVVGLVGSEAPAHPPDRRVEVGAVDCRIPVDELGAWPDKPYQHPISQRAVADKGLVRPQERPCVGNRDWVGRGYFAVLWKVLVKLVGRGSELIIPAVRELLQIPQAVLILLAGRLRVLCNELLFDCAAFEIEVLHLARKCGRGRVARRGAHGRLGERCLRRAAARLLGNHLPDCERLLKEQLGIWIASLLEKRPTLCGKLRCLLKLRVLPLGCGGARNHRRQDQNPKCDNGYGDNACRCLRRSDVSRDKHASKAPVHSS